MSVRPIDTSQLGPVRLEPDDSAVLWVRSYAVGERFEAMPLFTTADMVRAYRAGQKNPA